MKHRIIIFVILTALLCAGAFAQNDQNYATVYIYQLHHGRTLGRVAFPVYYDEKLIAKLDGERYFLMKVPAGNHVFRSKNKRDGGVEMVFEASKTYYLKMDTKTDMTLRSPHMILVPVENGAYEVKQMKPISAKDIVDASLIIKEP